MKITIESTDKITVVDGVPCRLWNGTTEAGTPCLVFVQCLGVPDNGPVNEFAAELKERLPPGRPVPLSTILPGHYSNN